MALTASASKVSVLAVTEDYKRDKAEEGATNLIPWSSFYSW